MWFALAFGASVFAALTSVLVKLGIDNVNSNLATAIRTFLVLIMSLGMAFLTNAQSGSLIFQKGSVKYPRLSPPKN